MGTPLFDKNANQVVDMDPAQVPAALKSGQFTFVKGRNVPIIQDGTPIWVKPEDAAKKRSQLLYTSDEEVERSQAEQKTAGLGGAAKALAYGGFKSGTLGLGPLLAGAVSPEAKETFRELELGRPGLTTLGELGGLAFDPFAAAAKLGGRAAGRVAVEATEAAGAAAAREAAPGFTEAVYEAERGIPALRPGPAAEAPSLRLGGQVAGAEPAAGAGYSAREAAAAAREPRALPPAGREPIAAPESPLTFQAPPFESQVMTDLRLGRANAADRLAELDQTIQLTLGSRARGARQSVRGLQEERAGLARQLEEYDFQLAKYEPAEAEALGAQAERAATAAEMRAPTSLMTGEVGAAAPEVKLGERAAAEAEQARQRLRMGGGAPEFVGPEPGPLALGRETGLAPAAAREGVMEAEFTENAALAPMREAFIEPTAAPAVEAGEGLKLGGIGRAALEQGIYGAASQAQRQQLGLEEGGLKEIAEAGLLGAGIGAGLTLGGQKLAKGAKALTEVASQSAGPDLGSRLGQAAARAEESALLRMFGLDKKAIKELNVRMVDAGAGKRGTSEFADFARNGIANLEKLKEEFPENQFLQSIDFSRGPLRFAKLNPEQRTAFAEALMNSTGRSIEDVYSQAAGQTVNSANLADAIMRVRSSLQSKGLGDLPMETIRGELKAFEDSLRRGEQYTVGSLREYEKNLSARFREARGKEPFTEAQKLFRDEVKKAYLDAAKEVIPDIEARLAVPNREYSIAERMFKGAQDVEARLAGTSPVGRDSLAQFALGVVAVLNPVGAVSFLIATTALRGIYNQRGEGILADLAGKLAGKGVSVVKAPQQAAQEAVSSVINARRPLLMGYNAERLVEASPADYTELAKSVRELQATRGEMQGRLEQAVSHLPPGEQQKALENFDQVVNTLASNLPKGLSTEKALSEQEKRYMVFARSVLDQVYGTQVVSNGGQYAEEAARAFQSVPGGKEYLDKFAEGLRTRINENEKLRGNEQLMQVYRNVKRASGVKGLSGGRKGAIMFSSSAMFGQGGGEGGGGGLGAAPKVGASARQQAGQSLAGVFKTQ